MSAEPVRSRGSARRSTVWRGTVPRKVLVFCVSLVTFALLAYAGSVVHRSRGLYQHVKTNFRGWRGAAHASDTEMGLRTIPGAIAAETFPIGPDVPTRISDEGFRVPLDLDARAPRPRPFVLALGCSVTYGAACAAEDTFAWHTAQQLGGTCLNAGLCSGGLAQMLVLARREIPKQRPDYVLVQYSPWLAERSRRTYAPTYMGRIPTPRFIESDGAVRLAEPAFGTRAFDLPIAEYKDTPSGTFDFLAFVARVGAPLLAHDDWHELCLWARTKLGAVPPPAPAEAIERAVYGEIRDLCRANGAALVVVAYDAGQLNLSWRPPAHVLELGVPVVEASEHIRALLPERTRAAYVATYQHVRGDPPVVVDTHPNARAHALIAEEIVRVLREPR